MTSHWFECCEVRFLIRAVDRNCCIYGSDFESMGNIYCDDFHDIDIYGMIGEILSIHKEK